MSFSPEFYCIGVRSEQLPSDPRAGRAAPVTAFPGPLRRVTGQRGGPVGVPAAPVTLASPPRVPQVVPGHRVRQRGRPHVSHAEAEEAARGARQVGAAGGRGEPGASGGGKWIWGRGTGGHCLLPGARPEPGGSWEWPTPRSAACAVAPCFPPFLKRGERSDHQLSRLDGKAAPRHLHGCTAGAGLEEEDHLRFFLNDSQGH